MFKEILESRIQFLEPEYYSIDEERWKTKNEATDFHEAVFDAEFELPLVNGFDWVLFSSDKLRDVWASDCSFHTKYLVTLWWGRVPRQIFNNVYSPDNLDRLRRISGRLERALVRAARAGDFKEFCKRLSAIVTEMQTGAYSLPYIGPAFFTKVIQFFFAAHPLLSQEDFLPISADCRLMRALYCEMADCGDADVCAEVFAIDGRNVFLRKDKKGSIAESYIKYVNYFNQRCGDLSVNPRDMEIQLRRNCAVQQRFLELMGGDPALSVVAENTVRLNVNDGPGLKREKAFQILNNHSTLPHNTDYVYVEYRNRWYEVSLKDYCSGGNMLKGKKTIRQLIKDNEWTPGQELYATFRRQEDGRHVYRILSSPA